MEGWAPGKNETNKTKRKNGEKWKAQQTQDPNNNMFVTFDGFYQSIIWLLT